MRAYQCKKCGATCTSNHATLKAEREIMGKIVRVQGMGLGTWGCPVHGKTKVVVAYR